MHKSLGRGAPWVAKDENLFNLSNSRYFGIFSEFSKKSVQWGNLAAPKAPRNFFDLISTRRSAIFRSEGG